MGGDKQELEKVEQNVWEGENEPERKAKLPTDLKGEMRER